MAGATTIYGLRYAELIDPPDGAALGKNLADDVEAELARIDGVLAEVGPQAGIVAAAGLVVGTNVVTVTYPVGYPVAPVVVANADNAIVTGVYPAPAQPTFCDVYLVCSAAGSANLSWVAVPK